MADWFYRRQDERFGPVSWDNLRQLIRSNGLVASDQVSQDSQNGWQPASEIRGLFLPPPFPPRQQPGTSAAIRTTRRAASVSQQLPEEKPRLAGTTPPEHPRETYSRLGDSGSKAQTGHTKEQTPFARAVVIVLSCLALIVVLVSAVLIGQTSRTPDTKNLGQDLLRTTDKMREVRRGHDSSGSSSLPVPADRDELSHALEEADRLWDSGQKAQAASQYSSAMESPCLAEFKEAVLQRLLPRVMEYYAEQNDPTTLDKLFRLAFEKGINMRHRNPAVQEHLNEIRAQVMSERTTRQLQEHGIPMPEGPVTQEFIDGVNNGLEWGQGMVETLRQVENSPSGVLPVVREQARQQQVEFCLKTLDGLDRENAEIASGLRAQGGDPGPPLQRRLGIAAGLRAAFRKAGIVL